MKSRELTLIAVFSALWITLQLSLGKIIGRISIGPISFHGAINRLVGWMVMVILAENVVGFGRVTLMVSIVSIITRIQRANVLEGLIVGLGYILAGVVFDILICLKKGRGVVFYLFTGLITAFVAVIPYWVSKIYFLGFAGFVIAFPLYAYRAIKSIILSIIGVKLGVSISYLLKHFQIRD